MKEQPILGYDWEMGHEEIKLEIGTYYTGKGLYIGMLAKEDGVWESFSDLTVNLRLRDRMFMRPLSRTLGVRKN